MRKRRRGFHRLDTRADAKRKNELLAPLAITGDAGKHALARLVALGIHPQSTIRTPQGRGITPAP